MDKRIYYIDAINGNDDNDGLSPDTALKTIARYIELTNLSAPIRFKSGQIFYLTKEDIKRMII